ncbi:hypothetical protein GCM10009808_13080 [Microbacterium sediminicola]|uniref:Uncharacterized protein n=1 Tax=Microbacterium sediminicola TaxID=415210 RepID=A0ABP4U1I2_9MICO
MTQDAGDVPEERPAPRYGVYATPEEQRARIQKPDVTLSLDAGAAPDDAAVPSVVRAAPDAAAQERSGSIDRIITFALLAYGLVNVVVAAFDLLDFATYADTVYAVIGIPDSFSDTGNAGMWGATAAVTLVVGFAVTAWFAVRAVLAHKRAWWIPLLGAVVTHIALGIVVMIPLMSDPAFTNYVASLG